MQDETLAFLFIDYLKFEAIQGGVLVHCSVAIFCFLSNVPFLYTNWAEWQLQCQPACSVKCIIDIEGNIATDQPPHPVHAGGIINTEKSVGIKRPGDIGMTRMSDKESEEYYAKMLGGSGKRRRVRIQGGGGNRCWRRQLLFMFFPNQNLKVGRKLESSGNVFQA